jgi:hypothetical protein
MDEHQKIGNLSNLWIVSPPRTARFAFDQPGMKAAPTTAREYRISAIGRYLVSPAALTVQKRLVGCEIHYQPFILLRWKQRLLRIIGKRAIRLSPPQSLIMDFPRAADLPADANLKHHIHHLYDSFRPFDSFQQNLDNVDPGRVAQVTGICEDDAGYRSPVAIDGSTVQQLDFVRRFVGRQIEVRLKRAHIADGLFEMKGFDFVNFDPRVQYRLIRFVHDGTPKACVTKDDHTIDFWLDDIKLVNYLQLFEHCIQHDHLMRESLYNCIQGKAAALRLMFNHRLEIDYNRAPLPAVFQEAIGDKHMADHSDHLIKQNLNHYQVGVSFNAMTLQASGGSALCTHISILQNLRALEPIKDRLPNLFAAMAERSAQSEEGNFYLLETICGVRNET